MDVRWAKQFQAKTKEDKQNLQETLMAGKHILDEAVNILKEERAVLVSTPKSDYDNASWAYKQAHVNGEVLMLDKIIKLLTIEEK